MKHTTIMMILRYLVFAGLFIAALLGAVPAWLTWFALACFLLCIVGDVFAYLARRRHGDVAPAGADANSAATRN